MKNRRNMALVSAVLMLAAVGVIGQVALAKIRPGSRRVVRESVLAALGGFRSLAAEFLWYRIDRLQEAGRFAELVQLTSMLTAVDPHDPEVWSYSAWNLAYNVSVRMPSDEDRWLWVYEGVRLLRDEALKWNPKEADLYRELAFMFELKIGSPDYDVASPIYQSNWRTIVEDVSRRDAWEELKMDRAMMAEVEKAYGVRDWTDAQASALYWAHCGLSCADERQKVMLCVILEQAKKIYDKRNPSKVKDK